MNHRRFIIIFLAVLVPTILAGVWPGISYGGFDCIAGCTWSTGLPFVYKTQSAGGMGGIDYPSTFMAGRLVLNIAWWIGVSLFVAFLASRKGPEL